ncbi:MAG: SUMF1/EgtB/PvdO family nonheme iron enzyme [Bacteroidota bacterium]
MNINKPFIEQLPAGPSFKMMLVEVGEFLMGGTGEEARENEKPIHRVILNSFYIGIYPVAQALWESVFGKKSSSYTEADCLVDMISWTDTQVFL